MAAAFPEENEEEERTCDVCTTAGNERLYKRIMRAIFADGPGTLEQALNEMEEPVYRKMFGHCYLLNIREKLFWRRHSFPDIGQFDEPIIQGRVWNAMQRLLSHTAKLKEIEQLPDQKAKVMAAKAFYRGLLLHVSVAHGDIIKATWIYRISGSIPYAAYDNCLRIPLEVAMLGPPNYEIRRAIELRCHEHSPTYVSIPTDAKFNQPKLDARLAMRKGKAEEQRLQWNEYVTSLGLTCYLLQERDMLNPERVRRFADMVRPDAILTL